MFFIFGTRLLGKVDVVPGFFHVATQFAHVNFIPLFPIQSYVVLSEDSNQFNAMPIPLNWKSVGFAWLRVLATIGGIIATVLAFLPMIDGPAEPADLVKALAIAACSAGFMWYVWKHKSMTHATFDRACEIGRLIGLNERGMARLAEVFGDRATFGFEVVAGSHPSPTTPAADAEPNKAGPRTFFVTGVYRSTREATCVTVWADDAPTAREIGEQRGIDVQKVEA